MIIPRAYQTQMVTDLRGAIRAGARNPVLQAATGAGKTVMAGMLVDLSMSKGIVKQVLVLVHRAELVKQFHRTLTTAGFGGRIGHICAGVAPDVTAPVQIGMVQTLVRRLDTAQISPDLIITDECHHGAAATYKKIYDHWPNAMRLGLSATPARTDGRGLDHFDAIVPGPPVQLLIDQGHLSDYDLLKVDGRACNFDTRAGDFRRDQLAAAAEDDDWQADTVKIFEDHCLDRRTLIFCATRAAARSVQQKLRARGHDVEYADGKGDAASKAQRLRALERFESGAAIALVSVDILGEGYDCPAADCCIMDRPTKSTILYLQFAGRVLRPSPVGRKALIIDPVGNTDRVGGGPRVPRLWTLKGVHTPGQERQERKATGESKPRKQKAILEARLVQVHEDAEMLIEPNSNGTGWRRTSVNKAVRRCRNRDEVETLAVALGYKTGWVDHMTTIFGIRT